MGPDILVNSCPRDTYVQQVTGPSTLYIKAVCLFGLKPLYKLILSIIYKTALIMICNQKYVKIQLFSFNKMLMKLSSAESLPY